jgi:hypothetical protein
MSRDRKGPRVSHPTPLPLSTSNAEGHIYRKIERENGRKGRRWPCAKKDDEIYEAFDSMEGSSHWLQR